MKTNYRKIGWLMIAIMLLSGCGVSKKVYQESQDNLAKAGAHNESLSKDLAAANEAHAKEVDGLKQTIGQLEAGQQAQAKEIADLKENAAQLDRAKQDEIEKLKATHDSLLSRNNCS